MATRRLVDSRDRLGRAVLGGESRFVLRATSQDFPLTIPAGAALEVGFGVASTDADNGATAVDFTVSFGSADGDGIPLLKRRIRPARKSGQTRWHDVTVPLEPVAGRSGTLRLQAHALGGPAPRNDQVFWNNPTLVVDRPVDRTNLILISMDSLRADHLRCYGHERNTSPNIDRMARGGALFRQAIAPSSWTLPSHASMFTGLYPSRHGATEFGLGTPMAAELATLPELLWDEGYATAGFVGGIFVSAMLGFDQGFDRYRDPGYRAVYPLPFKRNVDLAIGWMAERKGRPFFVFLHSYQVHMPYKPPEPYDTMFDPGYEGPYRKRFTGKDYRPFRWTDDLDARAVEHIEALYDGEVRAVDDSVGALLAFLDRSGLSENTCVVFTSDHGEEFKEHGNLFHHHAKLYEELIRIPLIVWCPSRFAGGRVIDSSVSLADVAPTLLEIGGAPIPDGLDGQSFYRALVGRELKEGRQTLSEVDGTVQDIAGSVSALRADRYKLITSTVDGSQLLFDLREDPAEVTDISAKRPDLVQKLAAALQAVLPRQSVRNEVDTTPVEPDSALRERLRALGYIP